MQTGKRVFKYVLDNGMTVLVCPKKLAPKVSLQLWYNVGSKHEVAGEKGMAHFIEHMIFKGTQKMLSESDINLITQKLSGYANAFTSYDYTGYLFDLPVANWEKILPIFADCMQNCSFEQDHMNSEVKAVIQELKMYRDDFTWTLADSLVTNIFESHPYHYPIIGYKQDLWNLKRQTLIDFYKKYYVPHNAALVIVGDVDPDQAFEKVQKEFGHIPRGADIVRPEFFINEDLQNKAVTIYRDVEQAVCMLAFVLPGAVEKKEFIYDLLGYLLANGKGSRLYKILVDEKELALSVHAMTYDLFDKEIFFIEFKPKKESDIAEIKEIILQEINDLAHNDIEELELRRALKLAQVDYQHLLQDVQKQAYAIGKSFIATGDEQYPFTYCDYDKNTVTADVQKILQNYFRSTLCHEGKVIKAPQADHGYLHKLQEESDKLDTQILFGKERTSPVAPGSYVDSIEVEKLHNQSYPVPQVVTLKNGLTVLLHHNADVDIVECALNYKANSHYDPDNLQGIGHLVAKLMLEGTKSYPSSSFIKEAESYGISISANAGNISVTMLCADIAKGLELLSEMVQHAEFKPADVQRVKNKVKSQLIQFWDTPKNCIGQVAAQKIYGNHPYGHMVWGTEQTLQNISPDICFDFYKKVVSPQQAVVAIVGNFDQKTIVADIEKLLGSWNGPVVSDLVYPDLKPAMHEEINIKKNRDQIVVVFAGLSVERLHPLYDDLLVFDQILTGGMSSKLFELREQSGLFYTIGGSIVSMAGKQPGMIFIKTIVSKDRLQEAQKAIAQCLDNSIDTVTQEEFEQAKEVVINTFPTLFETNENMASTFLFLQKYNLPYDYFQKRIETIRAMKLDHMKESVKKYLKGDTLVCIRIGRV
ncbi:MAG TPA: pitrilysin family protein [Candidatus Saccharimonadales bacterium]|nr:pitrilysin family protein [Candidatus Saccharimonadales bacterium]